MRWPWSTLALTAAVVVVQADLWLAPSNMPQVFSLERQLAEQLVVNAAAEERNRRTIAELSDLKEGLEMVEEKARRELGMVRADEILVQYARRPVNGAAAPAAAAAAPAAPGASVRAAPGAGPGGSSPTP